MLINMLNTKIRFLEEWLSSSKKKKKLRVISILIVFIYCQIYLKHDQKVFGAVVPTMHNYYLHIKEMMCM